MLERSLVTSIEKYLKKTYPGCYLIKLESPSTSGILDLYFAYGGVSFWFEVKQSHYRNKNWKNKKIQEWHKKQLIKNSIPAHFVFCLDDVKNIMQNYFPKF